MSTRLEMLQPSMKAVLKLNEMVLLLWQQHEKFRVRPRGSALVHEMKLEQSHTKAFFIHSYQFHFDIYFCTTQTHKFVCSCTVSGTRP